MKIAVTASNVLKRLSFQPPRPEPEALEEYLRSSPAARSAAAE